MKKVFYFFSCFNNYDILINEQRKFIEDNREKIIILDDHSSTLEVEKGKNFCKEVNVAFYVNKYKGLQMGLKFLLEEIIPDSAWLVCLQQDTFIYEKSSPISHLETRLLKLSEKKYPIGAVGFQNYVKDAHYHSNSELDYAFEARHTWLGVFFLSPLELNLPKKFIYKLYKFLSFRRIITKITKKFRLKLAFHRNFAPKTHPNFQRLVQKYEGVCAIELPVWAAVAINAELWKDYIKPDPRFIFHLWFPDIAMQFMSQNVYVCVDTKVHLVNDVHLKTNYGQLGSVDEGRKKNTEKMEPYGTHLHYFEEKWGFDYEFIYSHYEQLTERYKDTLVQQYFEHDPLNGPVRKFEL